MKSQDIVVLLKLISLQDQELERGSERLRSESIGGDPYAVRNLENLTGISKTEIAQSIKRSVASGIARKDNAKNEPRPHRRNLFNFIIHGLRFVFPANPASMQRGIPTAFAALCSKDCSSVAEATTTCGHTPKGERWGNRWNPCSRACRKQP